MGAIVGTKNVLTEFCGQYKVLHITANVASASDTISLTLANHGISVISGILGYTIYSGLDDHFTFVQLSYSGLDITVTSFAEDGSPADDFTGTSITVTILGY